MTRLVVRPVDTDGRLVPARISVRSRDDRRPWWPSTDHLRYDVVQPWGEERSFVTNGEATVEVPAGAYEVVVGRGPEFTEWRSQETVGADRATVVQATLDRWIDMAARGWYAGDVHIHQPADDLPLLMAAEGLDVGSSVGGHVDLGPRDNVARLVGAGERAAAGDVEVERIWHGPGAILGLGSGTGRLPTLEIGPWEPFDTAVAEALRAAGYHVDGEKIFWPSIPVLAALGLLDSVELASNHFGATWAHGDIARVGGFAPPDGIASARGLADWVLALYDALLGCGFRIAASGGSAAGIMANPIGASRTYVRLDRSGDGSPNHGRWLAALRAGHSFSTNGPLLELDVAGRGPGDEIAPGNEPVAVVVRAASARPLELVEIVVDGELCGQTAGADARPVTLEAEIALRAGGWIAARAFERPVNPSAVRFAQTSPVRIAGSPLVDKRAVELVRRWLRWTESLADAAERATGTPVPSAHDAIARAQAIVNSRARHAGSRP